MSTINDRIMTFKGKIGNHFSMNDKSYMIGSMFHKSIKTKAVRTEKIKTVLLAFINDTSIDTLKVVAPYLTLLKQ